MSTFYLRSTRLTYIRVCSMYIRACDVRETCVCREARGALIQILLHSPTYMHVRHTSGSLLDDGHSCIACCMYMQRRKARTHASTPRTKQSSNVRLSTLAIPRGEKWSRNPDPRDPSATSTFERSDVLEARLVCGSP